MSPPTTLGQHLRNGRLKLGLRQEDVAGRLGTVREVYDRWERDEREPVVSEWPGILSFLGYYPYPVETSADLVLKGRRCQGANQKRFANTVGVIHQRLRRWEHGCETVINTFLDRLVVLGQLPAREWALACDARTRMAALELVAASALGFRLFAHACAARNCQETNAMIDQALSFLCGELRKQTAFAGGTEPRVVLRSLVNPNGEPTAQGEQVLSLTLVGVEEEVTMRQPYALKKMLGNPNDPESDPTSVSISEAPLNLNLFVLASAGIKSASTSADDATQNYLDALHHLSAAMLFFQSNAAFTSGLPAGITKLVVSRVSMSFQDQHNLWGYIGGKYVPSALYKVSMVSLVPLEETDPGMVSEPRVEQMTPQNDVQSPSQSKGPIAFVARKSFS